MKYLKDIHEHLTNRSEVSKKLKKFFGVFAVALFMLSTASVQGTTNVEIKKDCWSICDYYADAVGTHFGLDHYDEYFLFVGCINTCD